MATCHTCHDIVSAHYTACNKAHQSLLHNAVTFLPAAQRAQHPCEHTSLLSASTGTGLYAWRQAARASSFPRPPSTKKARGPPNHMVRLLSLLLAFPTGYASPMLTAVADKGSTECNGEEQVTLKNFGTAEVPLDGYMLTDSKGREDDDAFSFAAGSVIAGGAELVMCKDVSDSFLFKIGGDDIVTLWDAVGKVVDEVTLLDQGEFDYVYTRDASDLPWFYQDRSTPARPSISLPVDPLCAAVYEVSADPDQDAGKYPTLCVSIETGGQSIPDEPKVPVNMTMSAGGTVVYTGIAPTATTTTTKSTTTTTITALLLLLPLLLYYHYYHYYNSPPPLPLPIYTGVTGIEIRGSSSQAFPKKQYAFKTWEGVSGAYEDVDVSLAGLPSEKSWILHAPYADKSLFRNVLSYDLAREMGQYASRCRFCVVWIDGDFNGVYVLMEKIKRDKNRVNVAKNKRDDPSGGWLLKIDKPTGENGNWQFSVPGTFPQQLVGYEYPKAEDVTSEQAAYISNYFGEFERRLEQRLTSYTDYIDVDSWVDYFLSIEVTKEVDAYRLSTYMHKDAGRKLRAGPIWDLNLGYGNADFCNGMDPSGFAYTNCGAIPDWWPTLLEEEGFIQAVQERWAELRISVFSLDNINGLLDGYEASIGKDAIDENFERWPILAKNVLYQQEGPFYDIYGAHLVALKTWIASRIAWLDDEIPNLQATWGEPRTSTPATPPSPLPPSPTPTLTPTPTPTPTSTPKPTPTPLPSPTTPLEWSAHYAEQANDPNFPCIPAYVDEGAVATGIAAVLGGLSVQACQDRCDAALAAGGACNAFAVHNGATTDSVTNNCYFKQHASLSTIEAASYTGWQCSTPYSYYWHSGSHPSSPLLDSPSSGCTSTPSAVCTSNPEELCIKDSTCDDPCGAGSSPLGSGEVVCDRVVVGSSADVAGGDD